MGSRQHKNLGDENLIYLSFFLSVESAAVRINGLCVTYCHERFPRTGVTARGSRRVRIINEFGLLKGSQFIKCTERSLPKFDLAEPRYFKLRSGFYHHKLLQMFCYTTPHRIVKKSIKPVF